VRPRIRLDKHLALKFLLIQHAALRYQQQLLDGIGKLIRPPQPQEPEVIVIEQEPDPHVWAHRWW
jgi:hypothetical protein